MSTLLLLTTAASRSPLPVPFFHAVKVLLLLLEEVDGRVDVNDHPQRDSEDGVTVSPGTQKRLELGGTRRGQAMGQTVRHTPRQRLA